MLWLDPPVDVKKVHVSFSHKRTFCGLCSVHYLTVPCYIKLPLRTVHRTKALFVALCVYLGVPNTLPYICPLTQRCKGLYYELGICVDLVLKGDIYNLYKTH